MGARATAWAPANIAFTKYWGWRDEALTLPFHDTVSMSLSACATVTTVAPATGEADEITLRDPAGKVIALAPEARARIAAHLDFLRERAGSGERLRVVSANTMPAASGVASSAAGFAALTLAGAAAFGLDPGERTLSVWARRSGSGSAARSVPGGFVRWHAGSSPGGEDSFAETILPPDHWDLADVVAVVETGAKPVSSREGHRLAPTSPHFAARLAAMAERNRTALRALRERDLAALGSLLEEETLSLHQVAETCRARVRYRTEASDAVVARVRELRAGGVSAYFTLDAGPNVHVFCEGRDAAAVREALAALPAVRYTIENRPGHGAHLEERHLF